MSSASAQNEGRMHRITSFIKEKLPWPLIKKVLTVGFMLLIAALLIHQGMNIEWEKVFLTLRETSPLRLLSGFGIAFLCYLVYGSYDLLGRYLTGIHMSISRTWFAAWLSYAFNLNLGAAVGGVAFRYRLYSKAGVSGGDATRIIALSITTNWLGYILLAGMLFVSGQITPPGGWEIGTLGLQLLGAAFLAIVLAYLAANIFSKKRTFTIRDFTVTLPGIRMAAIQLALASAHWTFMAATIYLFMPSDISFGNVFAVLLVSAVAGAVTHVPGAIGVLEAVFVAFLAHQASSAEIIAALFAYRCVFYLGPLALASVVYFIFEAATKDQSNQKPDNNERQTKTDG